MASLTTLRARLHCDRGAELIEFALTFPLLLLVVMGILDFGLLFQQYEVITNAAREGARVAVLPDYGAADAQARVNQYITASFLAQDGTPTVNVGAPQAVNIGGKCMTTVTVTVSYPHEFIFVGPIASYFGSTFGTKTLNASATMRTEVIGSACS